MNKKIIIIIFGIFILSVGIFIAGFVFGNKQIKNISTCGYKYTFVNKSLNCENDYSVSKSNLAELRQKLDLYIEESNKSGKTENISIYFRDLHNGPTMGINDDEKYFSASLLKLPISITYFKISEENNKGILQKELNFKLTKDYKPMTQNYKPIKTIESGSIYKIEDLIYNSLVYSDNLSNEVLKSTLYSIDNKKLEKKTLNELGLVVPEDENEDLSTRGYASIFRILYNASYLNLENSDKVLSILSESDFDNGIAAGIPKDIKLANKFGERDFEGGRQLHDCGIVYFPENPYLICIMTQGKEFKDLEKVISDISKMVYQEMESRRLK